MGEDAGEAQDPGLEVAGREVAVDPGEEGFEGGVEEAVEEAAGLLLLRELEHVIGQVAAEEDALQVGLEGRRRPDQVDAGDPAPGRARLLEPVGANLGQRLELAGEAAVRAAGAPGHRPAACRRRG